MPFLPVTKEDMLERGWNEPDFVLVTGDAYVDHSSFGPAIIGRVLESRGYRVAVLAQPDWKSADDFRRFGKPRLGFLIGSGNVDSMVNHFSVFKHRRRDDAYSPGGEVGHRPDRAVIVYSNRAREAYKDVPINPTTGVPLGAWVPPPSTVPCSWERTCAGPQLILQPRSSGPSSSPRIPSTAWISLLRCGGSRYRNSRRGSIPSPWGGSTWMEARASVVSSTGSTWAKGRVVPPMPGRETIGSPACMVAWANGGPSVPIDRFARSSANRTSSGRRYSWERTARTTEYI